MADTVTSQTIQDGQRVAVLKFTNESDGTGEYLLKRLMYQHCLLTMKVKLAPVYL